MYRNTRLGVSAVEAEFASLTLLEADIVESQGRKPVTMLFGNHAFVVGAEMTSLIFVSQYASRLYWQYF